MSVDDRLDVSAVNNQNVIFSSDCIYSKFSPRLLFTLVIVTFESNIRKDSLYEQYLALEVIDD